MTIGTISKSWTEVPCICLGADQRREPAEAAGSPGAPVPALPLGQGWEEAAGFSESGQPWASRSGRASASCPPASSALTGSGGSFHMYVFTYM